MEYRWSYFVSPQLWAWKKRRIRRVQRFVDRMLVIFPFEEPFYRERGVAAEFVGHPLGRSGARRSCRGRHSSANMGWMRPNRGWPCCRKPEARGHLNLPTMLEAATTLGDTYQYLVPVAPTLKRESVAAGIGGIADGRLPVLVEDARAALYHARASVVASGTATVETALREIPLSWCTGCRR